MKVVIFGSTGTVGRHLVTQSLEKGHQVLAFCRNKEKMSAISHSNLQIFEGDVFDKKDVAQAVKGQDSVLIVLGSGKKRKGNVRSTGTQHIIEAMKKYKVRRLICQSTLGAGESKGNLNFFWKYIMFGWFLKEVFLDHEVQEAYVRNSGLDWTIIRPGAFTDGKKTGQYLFGFSPYDRSLQLKISRADVADFILKQLVDKNSIHQTPGLSY